MAIVSVAGVIFGAAVAQGPTAALLVAGLLCIAMWAMRPPVPKASYGEPQPVAFALLLASLLLMPSNALRLNQNVTFSDAILVATCAAFLMGLVLGAARHAPWPRIPIWLFIATAGLVIAAALVEISPPSQISSIALDVTATSLYDINDPTTSAGDLLPPSNLVIASRFIMALLWVPLLLGALGASWRRLQLLMNTWLVAVAINCGLAGLAALGILSSADIVGRDYVLLGGTAANRYVGLTVHPTHLGTIAAMALPVIFVRLSARLRPGDVLLALLFMLGILFSGTRAALLGAVVGVAATLLVQRGVRMRRGTIALAATVTAVVAVTTHGALFATVDRLAQGNRSAAASDTTRIEAYSETFHAVIERPVVGYGFEVIRGGHNLYLELAHAGGIIALAAFLCFAWGLLRTGLRLSHDKRLPLPRRADAMGLTGAIVAWLTLSFVQNSVFDRFLYIPAGLLIALAACAYRNRQLEVLAIPIDRHQRALSLPPSPVGSAPERS